MRFTRKNDYSLRDDNGSVKLDVSFMTSSWNKNKCTTMQISSRNLSTLCTLCWIMPIFINQIKRDPALPSFSSHVHLILVKTISKKQKKNIVLHCLREWENARASTSKLRQLNNISVDFYTVHPTIDRYAGGRENRARDIEYEPAFFTARCYLDLQRFFLANISILSHVILSANLINEYLIREVSLEKF